MWRYNKRGIYQTEKQQRNTEIWNQKHQNGFDELLHWHFAPTGRKFAAIFGTNSKRGAPCGLDNLPARCCSAEVVCQVQELSPHVTPSATWGQCLELKTILTPNYSRRTKSKGAADIKKTMFNLHPALEMKCSTSQLHNRQDQQSLKIMSHLCCPQLCENHYYFEHREAWMWVYNTSQQGRDPWGEGWVSHKGLRAQLTVSTPDPPLTFCVGAVLWMTSLLTFQRDKLPSSYLPSANSHKSCLWFTVHLLPS